MDSMKQQNSGVDCWRSNVWRAVRNDRTDFDEFVENNVDVGDDEYKFASIGPRKQIWAKKNKQECKLWT